MNCKKLIMGDLLRYKDGTICQFIRLSGEHDIVVKMNGSYVTLFNLYFHKVE